MKHHHRPSFSKPKTTTTIYRGPKGTSVSTKMRSGASTVTTTRSANGKTRNTVSTKLGGVTQVGWDFAHSAPSRTLI